jgi:hypothetical protein
MAEGEQQSVISSMTVLTLPRNACTRDEHEVVYTTYNMAKVEERRLAFNCFKNDCTSLKDKINLEIAVVHVVAHPYVGVDENTGEEYRRMRIVMVCSDGECVACSSISVGRALQRLSSFIRRLPWNPPMRLKVKQIKSKGGQIYDLDPVGE